MNFPAMRAYGCGHRLRCYGLGLMKVPAKWGLQATRAHGTWVWSMSEITYEISGGGGVPVYSPITAKLVFILTANV